LRMHAVKPLIVRIVWCIGTTRGHWRVLERKHEAWAPSRIADPTLSSTARRSGHAVLIGDPIRAYLAATIEAEAIADDATRTQAAAER
jgi:hypothetical protein